MLEERLAANVAYPQHIAGTRAKIGSESVLQMLDHRSRGRFERHVRDCVDYCVGNFSATSVVALTCSHGDCRLGFGWNHGRDGRARDIDAMYAQTRFAPANRKRVAPISRITKASMPSLRLHDRSFWVREATVPHQDSQIVLRATLNDFVVDAFFRSMRSSDQPLSLLSLVLHLSIGRTWS